MAKNKAQTAATTDVVDNSENLPANVTESLNTATALAVRNAPLPSMEGWEQRGLPPIIKPAQIPNGAWMMGTIVNVVPSSMASIKNPLLYIEVANDNGTRYTVAFPCVATISSAFGVRPGEIATPEQIKPYIGHQIMLRKIGQAPAKKGQKRGAHLFQVYLKAPTKK